QLSGRQVLSIAFDRTGPAQVLGFPLPQAGKAHSQLFGELVHVHIASQQRFDGVLFKVLRISEARFPLIFHFRLLSLSHYLLSTKTGKAPVVTCVTGVTGFWKGRGWSSNSASCVGAKTANALACNCRSWW